LAVRVQLGKKRVHRPGQRTIKPYDGQMDFLGYREEE